MGDAQARLYRERTKLWKSVEADLAVNGRPPSAREVAQEMIQRSLAMDSGTGPDLRHDLGRDLSLIEASIYRLRSKVRNGGAADSQRPFNRARRIAHSRELGVAFRAHPEAFLSNPGSGPDVGGPMVETRYGLGHLQHEKAYPRIAETLSSHTAAVSAAKKQKAELQLEVLRKIRVILRTLYPGLPEFSGVGPTPEQFTVPDEVAREVVMELQNIAERKARSWGDIIAVPAEKGWRVARSGVTTYAMVATRPQTKVRNLKRELRKLVAQVPLRRQQEAIQSRFREGTRLRITAVELVGDLGARLGHGELIRGTCGLGY